MFVSDKYKFIFLHMPKTGGTSVRNALQKIDIQAKKRECFLHSNAMYSKAFLEKTGRKWEDYFKFSIVRDPYPRMVSFYEHMVRIRKRHEFVLNGYRTKREKLLRGEYQDIRQTVKFKDLEYAIMWDGREVTKYNYDSFEDFIKNPYYWMHRLNTRKIDFTVNYVDWLSIDGEIAVDFVMKLENIKDDWGIVLDAMKLPKKSRVEIGHDKKGSNIPDWKLYYNDELTEIVANRFRKDFEYFGYN